MQEPRLKCDGNKGGMGVDGVWQVFSICGYKGKAV